MLFWKYNFYLLLIVLLTLVSCENQNNLNEKAIKESSKAYELAFNKKDAQALASLWAEDAKYVVPLSGEVIEGRAAISDKFTFHFQDHPDSEIEIKTESIIFPSSNEAVEIATGTIKQNGEVLEQKAYKVFYDKQDGKWLISELREVDFVGPPQPSEHLKELEWIIGDWIDEDEDTTIISHYQWDRYKNFITQNFLVQVEGTFQLEGKQVIGWDPIKGTIRSWVFDSDGSFGEADWKKQDDSWVVETSSTLADGSRASAINIFTPIDENQFTWQSTGRTVGGELLPDVDPVTVARKKS